ncbi:MetQ/NlpA family ABC transporter substrate-binding protein [Campylobacter sp. RM16188]|nr:MetQ/NlpA family ABC transporter substrate-binding protein [Campylobacter sp. RM16188]
MKLYKKATQATLCDIVENPKNLKFIELKEAQIHTHLMM